MWWSTGSDARAILAMTCVPRCQRNWEVMAPWSQKRVTGLVVLGEKQMEKIHGMTNNVIRATQLNVGNKHQTHEIIRIPSWGQRLQDDSIESVSFASFFVDRGLNRWVVGWYLWGSRRLNRKGWGICLNSAARKSWKKPSVWPPGLEIFSSSFRRLTSAAPRSRGKKGCAPNHFPIWLGLVHPITR